MSRVIEANRLWGSAEWCSDNRIPLHLAQDARIVRHGKFVVTRDAYLPGIGLFAKLANNIFCKTVGTPLRSLGDWASDAWERVYLKSDLTPRTMPLVWFAPNTSREIYV